MSPFRRWLRPSGRRHRAETPTRLEVCAQCGERFVYPVSWEESGPADWWLLLRCGGCETWREVVASNYAADEFDRLLDEQMDVIEAAVDRLERESFKAEADTFGAALQLDLLGADDFR